MRGVGKGLGLLVLIASVYGGCLAGNCVPGELRECACLQGVQGVQVCREFDAEWSICSCANNGDGGGSDAQAGDSARRFLTGRYRSTSSEKSIAFDPQGKYQIFQSEAQRKAGQALISSRYFVVGQRVTFNRADGSQYSLPGNLAENDSQLTWAEFPGEVFLKTP